MVTKFKADPNSKTTSPTSADFLIYENDDKIDSINVLVKLCDWYFLLEVLELILTY